jgi:hypothetical protein
VRHSNGDGNRQNGRRIELRADSFGYSASNAEFLRIEQFHNHRAARLVSSQTATFGKAIRIKSNEKTSKKLANLSVSTPNAPANRCNRF